MDNTEKKIQQRIQSEQIPSKVDPDALWAKLEPQIPTSGKSDRRVPTILMLAGNFLLCLFGYQYYSSQENNLKAAKVNSNSHGTTFSPNNTESSRNMIPSSGSIVSPEPRQQSESTIQGIQQQELEIKSSQSDKTGSTPSINEVSENNIPSLTQEIFQENINVPDVENRTSPINSSSESVQADVLAERDADQAPGSSTQIPEKTSLFSNIPSLAPKPIQATQKQLNFLTKPVSIHTNRRRFDVGLFTGIYTLSNHFSSNNNSGVSRSDLLNKGFNLEPGYAFSLELAYHINRTISLNTGLQYFKTWEEFNYMSVTDSVVWSDYKPGGGLVHAKFTRTVKHHNAYKTLSIPVLASVKKSFNHVEAGVNMGIGLNMVLSQSGRSLASDGTITDFPNDENSFLPRPDFYLSYMCQPFVRYRWSESMAFQLGADVRFEPYGTSEFYKLNYRSFTSGLKAGLLFSPSR